MISDRQSQHHHSETGSTAQDKTDREREEASKELDELARRSHRHLPPLLQGRENVCLNAKWESDKTR